MINTIQNIDTWYLTKEYVVARDRHSRKCGVMNTDREWVIPCLYANIEYYSEYGVRVQDWETRRWGIVDWENHILLPIEHYSISGIRKDMATYQSYGYAGHVIQYNFLCLGLLDPKGNILLESGRYQFPVVVEEMLDGLKEKEYEVVRDIFDGMCSVISNKGNLVSQRSYIGYLYNRDELGCRIRDYVLDYDRIPKFYHTEGIDQYLPNNQVLSWQHDIRKCIEGDCIVEHYETRKKGVLDVDGNEMIPFDFYDVKRIDRGYYAVKDTKKGKWYFISNNQRHVIKGEYTNIVPISKQYIGVEKEKDKGYYIVDLDGKRKDTLCYRHIYPTCKGFWILEEIEKKRTLLVNSKLEKIYESKNTYHYYWDYRNQYREKVDTIGGIYAVCFITENQEECVVFFDEKGKVLGENISEDRPHNSLLNIVELKNGKTVCSRGDKIFFIQDGKIELEIEMKHRYVEYLHNLGQEEYLCIVTENESIVMNDKGERLFSVTGTITSIMNGYFAVYQMIDVDKWESVEWLVDKKGTSIIPYQYQEILSGIGQTFCVKLNDKWGIIDENGKEILPCIYHNIFYKAEDSYEDQYSDTLYRICYERDGVEYWGLYDPVLEKEIIPYEYLNIEQIKEEIGVYKIKNTEEKWGIISVLGEWIIPCEYEDIEVFNPYMYQANVDDRTVVFFDKFGKKIIEFIDMEIQEGIPTNDYDFSIIVNSMIRLYDKNTGCYGYMDAKGNIIKPCIYTKGSEAFGDDVAIVEKDGVYNLLSVDGELFTKRKYSWIKYEGDGEYHVEDLQTKQRAIVDKNETIMIPFSTDSYHRICIASVASIYHDGDFREYIEQTLGHRWYKVGRYNPKVDAIQYAFVNLDNGKCSEFKYSANMVQIAPNHFIVQPWDEETPSSNRGLLNIEGEEVVPCVCKDIDIYPFSNAMKDSIIIEKDGGILIFIDYLTGEFLTEISFDENKYFCYGKKTICCCTKDTGKYGIMNYKGEIVEPFQWDNIYYDKYYTYECKDIENNYTVEINECDIV